MWKWSFRVMGEPFHRSPQLAILAGDWKPLFNPRRLSLRGNLSSNAEWERTWIPTAGCSRGARRRSANCGAALCCTSRAINIWRARRSSALTNMTMPVGRNARPLSPTFTRVTGTRIIRRSLALRWRNRSAPIRARTSFARRTGLSFARGSLFHLKTDIGEQNNLAEKEPARLKQLAAAWEKWNAELISAKWTPQQPARNRETSGQRA
jgi:hypothetical protein